MPRLGRFWTERPEIGLEIVPSPELVDLRRDGFDAAIRYGAGGLAALGAPSGCSMRTTWWSPPPGWLRAARWSGCPSWPATAG